MPRSNQKWCAHPVSHQGARMSGPGALRPRGNRPIDTDLAAFITQEYYQANANVGFALSEGDLLCRTCYETESPRFHTHLAVEGAKSRESDGKHPRRSSSRFSAYRYGMIHKTKFFQIFLVQFDKKKIMIFQKPMLVFWRPILSQISLPHDGAHMVR